VQRGTMPGVIWQQGADMTTNHRNIRAFANLVSVALILTLFAGLGAAGLFLMGGHP
jgi:hypothetical protein